MGEADRFMIPHAQPHVTVESHLQNRGLQSVQNVHFAEKYAFSNRFH